MAKTKDDAVGFDPAGLSHERDADAIAARERREALRTEIGRKRSALRIDEQRAQQTRDEARRTRALARADNRAKGEADHAYKAAEGAEAAAELTQGELLVAERELADVEARLPAIEQAAYKASAEAFRGAASERVRRLAVLLLEAEAVNEELRALRTAAETAFPASSAPARLHGTAASLPERLAFASLSYDPYREDGSVLGTWARVMAEWGLLTQEERQTFHASARAEHAERVARDAARVDPRDRAIAARKAQLVASGEYDKAIRERSPRFRVVGTGSDTRIVQE